MSIQKINFIYPDISYKKDNSKVNIKTFVSSKNISDLKNMPYFYPVSFGGLNGKEKASDLNFDDSIKKYYRLSPDKYQIEAAQCIYDNDDPLVLAPTGTGKTLIAEYAINKNLAEGKRTFYTTPLKALSNEKYTDFSKLYGRENVGLLTGDIKINPDAPVVVMTTEIYRNMLLGEDKEDLEDRLKDVETVVYDEFHYMNDPDRGEVWETSIMYTPPFVQQILLSATADNGEVINKWMNRLLTEKNSQKAAKVINVPADERHVPLKYYIYDPKRSNNSITPLANEKYNIKKLEKSLNPEKKAKLTDKQKDVLREISKAAKLSESVENGILALKQIAPQSDNLSVLEEALVKKLNFERIEAQRAAAILSDKALMTFNEKLKTPSQFSKKDKQDFYSRISQQKVIGSKKIKELQTTKQYNHRLKRALVQYSRLTNGNSTPEDALLKLNKVIKNKNMSVKEFETLLNKMGLNAEYSSDIAKALTVIKKEGYTPFEFDLINVLQKEDKLPAIFFVFSKNQCNKLRNEFLKTGVSLLTPEEKVKAAEIIKKHMDKDVFLGTGETPEALLSGVAVHHAGKMPSYKALVEELAQNKLVKVVFATSTLGAGINVPAKTVVFTQLTRYGGQNGAKGDEKFVSLTSNEFHQMAGRAGRRGKDSIGNVIIMPDRSHGASSIYNLVISKPDAINSNFKPTYSFISHFITREGSTEKLPDAVDKSFLKENLESAGIKPYKVMSKIKKEFIAMSKVLTDKETGCFVEQNGKLVPTLKGEMVSKTRGVDGLLFASVILNGGLEYLSPQELAAVACSLTESSDRDETEPVYLDEVLSYALSGIEQIYSKIIKIQDREHVQLDDIKLNRVNAQYIYQWVNADGEDSRLDWEKIIRYNTKNSKSFNEGDFLKSVNRTIDITEQIKELTSFAIQKAKEQNADAAFIEKMKKINITASKALVLLKRDPVKYEL